MEVDEDAGQAALIAEAQQDANEDDSDEENEDNPSDVALVPIADMLNARHGAENVGRFSFAHYSLPLTNHLGKIVLRSECTEDDHH
jgi:hypothetical protein